MVYYNHLKEPPIFLGSYITKRAPDKLATQDWSTSEGKHGEEVTNMTVTL